MTVLGGSLLREQRTDERANRPVAGDAQDDTINTNRLQQRPANCATNIHQIFKRKAISPTSCIDNITRRPPRLTVV